MVNHMEINTRIEGVIEVEEEGGIEEMVIEETGVVKIMATNKNKLFSKKKK